MSTGPVIGDASGVRPIRSRRGRFGTFAAVVVLVMLVGGLGVRTWRGSGVPDAPEPFDVAAFRRAVLPEATNAYPLMEKARGMLGSEIAKFSPILMNRDQEWATSSDEARAWVEKYRPALLVFREAASRPDLGEVTPGGSQTEKEIIREMPMWCQYCLLEAGRLEAAGDLAGAWEWHKVRLRAMLLASRWADAIERRHTSYHFARYLARAQVWAESPEVTPALLRRAIADLEAMTSLFPKASEVLKRDYLHVLAQVDSPDLTFELDRPWTVQPPGGAQAPTPTVAQFTPPLPLRPVFRRVEWWLAGEPSRSRRLLRLIFANWLAQADKPADARTRVVSETPLVFDADPGTTPPLPPARLARAATSAPILSLLLDNRSSPIFLSLRFDQWREALAVDRRARANLIVALASRIQEIETGKYPASTEELVGKTLPKLPDDYVVPDGGDVVIVPQPRP